MIEDTLETTLQEPSASTPAKGGRGRGTLVFVMQVTAIALLFVAAVGGFARWRTGSLGLVVPYLAGQRLFFEPARISLGAVPRGTLTLERELRVINTGSEPRRVLGARRSCACLALDQFPILVPAGEEVHLRLKIGMPRKPMAFEHSIKFFSDDPRYSSVVIPVKGSIP